MRAQHLSHGSVHLIPGYCSLARTFVDGDFQSIVVRLHKYPLWRIPSLSSLSIFPAKHTFLTASQYTTPRHDIYIHSYPRQSNMSASNQNVGTLISGDVKKTANTPTQSSSSSQPQSERDRWIRTAQDVVDRAKAGQTDNYTASTNSLLARAKAEHGQPAGQAQAPDTSGDRTPTQSASAGSAGGSSHPNSLPSHTNTGGPGSYSQA